MDDFLNMLETGKIDYSDLMTLKLEKRVIEIPRIWNNLDTLTPETKMVHTTNRLTQPWKTGLPVDFKINPMPKIFGIIPREPIHKLLGKYPTHYTQHPDKQIEKFFINLTREALEKNAISRQEIEDEIRLGQVRADLLSLVS